MERKDEMLTSRLQPDEFSRAYRGRLKTLNCFNQTKNFIAALIAELIPQGSQLEDYPEVTALALAAGLPVQTFLKSHSLQPLFQMVPPAEKSANQGDSAQLDMTGWHGIRTWERIGARFCLECIAEEIGVLGYAYWHRSHQLPGICWCAKHETQLAMSALNNNAFDAMPSLELEATYEFSEDVFDEIFSNKVIQRYADIVHAILNTNIPLSSIHAIYRMSELLKVHQIRIGKNGQRPTLTDRLLDQLPVAWLQSHYPSIENRGPKEYFHAIDSIASRPVANHVYALGLSSLFESSDDALNYWFSNTDGLPNVRKSNRRYEMGYWNSDEIYGLYVKLRGNHSKIAEALGSNLTFTKNALNAAGLPSLWNQDMAALGVAISAIQLGMSIEMACASNGVSQGNIEKLLTGEIAKLLRAIVNDDQKTP